jgi:hypothetical protein
MLVTADTDHLLEMLLFWVATPSGLDRKIPMFLRNMLLPS